MPKQLKGTLDGQGLRIAVVVAKFNEFITRQLLTGAVETLSGLGLKDADITVAWVPGAFELPLVAKTLAQTGQYDAVVCLGSVIRGETDHYDMVAGQSTRGIGDAAMETGVPVLFGVLTTEDIDQAIQRCGGKSGNAGSDAAVAAVETARLIQSIKGVDSKGTSRRRAI